MRAVVCTEGISGLPELAANTWVALQYVLGLDRLGVEAFWVDRLACLDGRSMHSLPHLCECFARLARDFGFEGRQCIDYGAGQSHAGLSAAELRAVVAAADLLLSLGKSSGSDSIYMQIPRRAYIDLDPGFTQLWLAAGELDLAGHTHHFTVGFSTVADWWAAQTAQLDGEAYGSKRDEFLRVIDVPRRARIAFEPALLTDLGEPEIHRLREAGWGPWDAYAATGNPHSYRDFIQSSRAEFSAAKHGYVKSNSGWLSDRTACYLASGKPAVVQSTGVEGRLPTGHGLLTYSSADEAVAAIAAIDDDYRSHCQAARALAEQEFDSDRVLAGLLEHVGL